MQPKPGKRDQCRHNQKGHAGAAFSAGGKFQQGSTVLRTGGRRFGHDRSPVKNMFKRKDYTLLQKECKLWAKSHSPNAVSFGGQIILAREHIFCKNNVRHLTKNNLSYPSTFIRSHPYPWKTHVSAQSGKSGPCPQPHFPHQARFAQISENGIGSRRSARPGTLARVDSRLPVH